MSKISKNGIKFLLAGLSCMAPLSASGADLQYQNIYYIPPGMHVSKVLPPKIENDDTYSQSYKQKDDSSIEAENKYLRSSEKNEDSSEVKRVLYDSKNKKNSKKKNLIKYGPWIGVGALCVVGGVACVARAIQNNELDTLKKKKIDSFYEMQHNLDVNTSIDVKQKELDSYYKTLLNKFSDNPSMLYKINEIYEGRSYDLLNALTFKLKGIVGSLKNKVIGKTAEEYMKFGLYNSCEKNTGGWSVILADYNYCGLKIPVLLGKYTSLNGYYPANSITDINSSVFEKIPSTLVERDESIGTLLLEYLNKYKNTKKLSPHDIQTTIEEICKLLCYTDTKCLLEKKFNTYLFTCTLTRNWPIREIIFGIDVNNNNQDQMGSNMWIVSETEL